jgi:hypothetical protein
VPFNCADSWTGRELRVICSHRQLIALEKPRNFGLAKLRFAAVQLLGPVNNTGDSRDLRQLEAKLASRRAVVDSG